MRTRTGKPEFQYEIACAQLCGLGHYRMRGFVTVQSAGGVPEVDGREGQGAGGTRSVQVVIRVCFSDARLAPRPYLASYSARRPHQGRYRYGRVA